MAFVLFIIIRNRRHTNINHSKCHGLFIFIVKIHPLAELLIIKLLDSFQKNYSRKKCRLLSMIGLTASFGYVTNSMTLVADSFHVLSDVVSLWHCLSFSQGMLSVFYYFL